MEKPKQIDLDLQLYKACKAKDIIKMREAIKNGADVNFNTIPNDNFAFMCGVGDEYAPVVRELLKHDKFDRNKLAYDGRCNLNWACDNVDPDYNRLEIVWLLLNDKKVNINTVDRNGRTPFMNAAKKGHSLFIALFLVLRGDEIDLNEKDKFGQTALDLTYSNSTSITGQLQVRLILQDPKGCFDALKKLEQECSKRFSQKETIK